MAVTVSLALESLFRRVADLHGSARWIRLPTVRRQPDVLGDRAPGERVVRAANERIACSNQPAKRARVDQHTTTIAGADPAMTRLQMVHSNLERR